VISVPATEFAKEIGNIAVGNVIILAVYILASGTIDLATLRAVMPLSIKRKDMIDINMKAIQKGEEFYMNLR